MRADVTVENPDDVKINLSITLTLKEWRQIAGRLESADEYWPWKGFAGVITNAIKKVNARIVEMSSEGHL
jgi:hypothetical protein